MSMSEALEQPREATTTTDYEAFCGECQVKHPCKLIAGDVIFSPERGSECPNRGLKAMGFTWVHAPA